MDGIKHLLALTGYGTTAEERARFRCLRCGRCCIVYPVLHATPDDIERIERAGHDRSSFLVLGRYLRRPGGRCVFLRRDADGYACEIYEHRTDCCRSYPFHELSADVAFTWSTRCPGLRRLRAGLSSSR